MCLQEEYQEPSVRKKEALSSDYMRGKRQMKQLSKKTKKIEKKNVEKSDLLESNNWTKKANGIYIINANVIFYSTKVPNSLSK